MLLKSAPDRKAALLAVGVCLSNKSERPSIGLRARLVFTVLIMGPALTPGRPTCNIKTCPSLPDRVRPSMPCHRPLQAVRISTVIMVVVMRSPGPSSHPINHRGMHNIHHTVIGVASQRTPQRGRSNLPDTKCHHKSRGQIYNTSTILRRTGPPQPRHHSPQTPHSLLGPTPTTSLSTTASILPTEVARTRPNPGREVAPTPRGTPNHHPHRRNPTRPPCHRKTTGSHPYRAHDPGRRRPTRPRRTPTSSRSSPHVPSALRLDRWEKWTTAIRAWR